MDTKHTQHTSGPWKYGRPGIGSDSRLRVWYEDEEGFTTAQVCEVYAGTNEEANARLIAAAPDLLAIAKRWEAAERGYCACWAYNPQSGVLCRGCATRAAIAKATSQEGQSPYRQAIY